MKRFILTAALFVTIACGNLFAANWITVTTEKGNVFHIDTEAFSSYAEMMTYIMDVSNALDSRYPDGDYNH